MSSESWENLLPEPMFVLGADGTVVDMNHAARLVFHDLAVGGELHYLANDPNKLASSLTRWARSGQFTLGLVVLSSPDGERYITHGARIQGEVNTPARIIMRCLPESSANQRFVELTRRINALNREVARRQHAERLLFAEKELAQVTLQSIGDAVITTDIEGRVNYLNPVAETLTGWSEAEARGLPLPEVFRIFDEHTHQPAENPVERVLAYGHTVGLANHTVLLHRDGTRFSIDDSAAPIRDRDGQLIGVVMVFHDVTHARKLAAKVSYQASHDGLTGLLNRQAFEQRLRGLLEAPGGMDTSHSLMFLDLDQFKVVNDTCGHLAGDALLRALGPVLQKHLRHSDVLARLGGDEFGVLLQDCPEPVATRIASALKEEIDNFNFSWEGKPFRLGLSIGQVNFSDANWPLTDLLSAADNACYLAKENGRNRIHLYSSDDQELAHRFQQTQWVGRIREAFKEERFRLYCQAIAPVASSSPVASGDGGAHFELLLRLHDKEGKLVPPMAFIPAAERYNLMVSIDQWVVETALAQLSDVDPSHIATCTINLSGASLGDEDFLQFVDECFERYDISPRLICFEITETEAIANLANARHIIEVLKGAGCRFALDDFGSGMSSFGYLKNLPVDYLKIDGAFIKNIADDPIDRAMVEAINNIGHVMGLKTIAEFVNSPPTLQVLQELGVDYAQGYGIAKPVPLEIYLTNLNSDDYRPPHAMNR